MSVVIDNLFLPVHYELETRQPMLALADFNESLVTRDMNLRIGQHGFNMLNVAKIPGIQDCLSKLWDPFYLVSTDEAWQEWFDAHVTLKNLGGVTFIVGVVEDKLAARKGVSSVNYDC